MIIFGTDVLLQRLHAFPALAIDSSKKTRGKLDQLVWGSIPSTKDGAQLRAVPFRSVPDGCEDANPFILDTDASGRLFHRLIEKVECLPSDIAGHLPTMLKESIILHAEKLSYLFSSQNNCRVPETKDLFREKRTFGNIVHLFIQRTGKLG